MQERSGIEQVVTAISGPDGNLTRFDYHAKMHGLALMFPALSAGIAKLLEENNHPIPDPLRHARNIIRQEQP